MASSDDGRALDEVLATLRTAIDRGREMGATGVDLLGTGVDEAMRSLVSQRVDRALRVAPSTVDASELTAALEPSRSASSVAGRVGQVGGRLARHSRAARTVAGRTPTGLALRWGPMLVDTVRSNLGALDATAAHLVSRARRAGIDPDPALVRAAVVQALSGSPVDPSAPVDHTSLLRTWLRASGSRLLPLGLGAGLRHRRSPAEVVAALGELDVGLLRRR